MVVQALGGQPCQGGKWGAIEHSGLFIPNYYIPCRKPDGPDQEENKFTLGRETLERVSSE